MVKIINQTAGDSEEVSREEAEAPDQEM